MCVVRNFWVGLISLLLSSSAFALPQGCSGMELQGSVGFFFSNTPKAAQCGAYQGSDICSGAKPFIHEKSAGKKDQTWVQFGKNTFTVAYAQHKPVPLVGFTHYIFEGKTYKLKAPEEHFDKALKPIIEKVIKDHKGGCEDGSKFDDFLKMWTGDNPPEWTSKDMGDGTKLEGYFFGNDKTNCFISTNDSYSSSCSPSGKQNENGEYEIGVGDEVDVADYLGSKRGKNPNGNISGNHDDNAPPNPGGSTSTPQTGGSSSSGSSNSGGSTGSSSGSGGSAGGSGSSSNSGSDGSSGSTGSGDGSGTGQGSGSNGTTGTGQGSDGEGDGDDKCEGEDCPKGENSLFPELAEFDLKKAFTEFRKSQEDRFKSLSSSLSATGQCQAVNISANFGIFSVNETIDLHCQIFSQISGLLTAAFMFIWSLMALRIVLSA